MNSLLWIGLIPILVILLIIAIVFGAVKKMINKKAESHVISKVFIGYLVIMLICLVLDIIHPLEKSAFHQIYSNSKELEKEQVELIDAATEGRFSEINPKMLKAKWDFEYRDTKLNLAFQNGDYYNAFVVVERKKINDGKIEARFYKSPSSIDKGIDSYKANPIRIESSGGTLFLIKPKPVKIKFSQFENAFTVTQFTGDKWFHHETNLVDGQSVIYLRIPKNLKLVDQSNINFQFVN